MFFRLKFSSTRKKIQAAKKISSERQKKNKEKKKNNKIGENHSEKIKKNIFKSERNSRRFPNKCCTVFIDDENVTC